MVEVEKERGKKPKKASEKKSTKEWKDGQKKAILQQDDHSGHRLRLMRKIEDESICPHELLELLLFYAIPRQNTNPLAHRLLAEFGSVYNILSASVAQLVRVNGIGERTATFLVKIGKLVNLVNEQEQSTFPAVFERESFLPYAKREYSRLPYEVLDMFFLDAENVVLRRRRFSTANAKNVFLKIDELSEELVKDNVSGLVIVHNHPSGNVKPSAKDDLTTKKCQSLCNMHNVLLCEHIICGESGVYSYYGCGRLAELSRECSLD